MVRLGKGKSEVKQWNTIRLSISEAVECHQGVESRSPSSSITAAAVQEAGEATHARGIVGMISDTTMRVLSMP